MQMQHPELKSGFLYAKHLTTHYSKSFTMATRMLPVSKRWQVYAMYGFCRFADNLIDKPRNRTSEEILDEIDCLRHELEIAYRTGCSEHPVLNPFIHAALQFDIPHKYPDEFLEGVAMDLTRNRYQTFDELYLFCYRVAGLVGIMMTYVLGYTSDEAFACAEKLGIAMQLTNILRDVAEDKNMGRIYIPESHWNQFNVNEADFLNENFTPDFASLMAYECKLAQQYYTEAQPGIDMLTQNTQFAIRSASEIYSGILNQIEQNEYNPFRGRVFVSTGSKLKIILKQYMQSKFSKRNYDKSTAPKTSGMAV